MFGFKFNISRNISFLIEEKQQIIIDQIETNLVILRCKICLIIQSSIGDDDCAHKLLQISMRSGQELYFVLYLILKMFIQI